MLYITAMKKTLLLSLLSIIVSASALFAQNTEKKGWTSEERYTFLDECAKTAKANMSSDSARDYCHCMQEKLEKKFPNVLDIDKSLDLESPEMKKNVQSCLGSGSTWTAKDRTDFLKECVDAARASLGEDKAKRYCACSLYKIERKYPDPSQAAEITEEVMASPDFKKMIQECLAF